MLKVGDKVVMNDKYHVPEKNKGKEFIVTVEPQEVCGTLCVWLEGYRGCYAADGLTKVASGPARQTRTRGARNADALAGRFRSTRF